jgi:L-ribulose-5-phosphate 3-epimerase
MRRIGIMQGRLLPPVEGRFQCFPGLAWSREFPLAAQAGLEAIEWIYDLYGDEQNPLGTDAGVDEIRSLSAQHGVSVASLCADYFMDRPLVKAKGGELAELVQKLTWLMERCHLVGMERMVLPFVDNSRIENQRDQALVVDILRDVLPAAHTYQVEIHLETSLAPAAFSELLGRLPDSHLKANYDSGNSASLGYKPEEELAAYGHRLGSVHIKDRVLNGGTVPLGTGDTDFPALMGGLRRLDYQGDFVLQAARGEPEDEVPWAIRNRAFLLDLLQKSSSNR